VNNGNREPERVRVLLLSTRSASRTGEQCSANKYAIERSELNSIRENKESRYYRFCAFVKIARSLYFGYASH